MLRNIVSTHASEAAFYWTRFMDGTTSPLMDLHALARFEHLLEANLEGLRVADAEGLAQDAGFAATYARLLESQATDDAFVSAMLALDVTHLTEGDAAGRLAGLATLACEQHDALVAADPAQATELPPVGRGLASAGAWLPWEQVRPAVFDWARSNEPVLRCAALAICALQRQPAGAALSAWVQDEDPMVQARALQAVGELGRDDLKPLLLDALQHSKLACRRQAAGSLALIGSDQGANVLGAWASAAQAAVAQATDPLAAQRYRLQARHAVSLLAQVTGPLQRAQVISAALQSPAHQRNGLDMIRFSGDLHCMDLLLDLCEAQMQPQFLHATRHQPGLNTARMAGDVFAHLTGAPLGEDDRWMPAPEDDGDEGDDPADDPQVPVVLKHDPDEGLLWPNLPRLKDWWQRHRGSMQPAAATLCGGILTPRHAVAVVSNPAAPQLQRHHAALWLRSQGHAAELFDVRASVRRQRALFPQDGG
jgi:uncharacterized protein (TIGR02270 family)